MLGLVILILGILVITTCIFLSTCGGREGYAGWNGYEKDNTIFYQGPDQKLVNFYDCYQNSGDKLRCIYAAWPYTKRLVRKCEESGQTRQICENSILDVMSQKKGIW